MRIVLLIVGALVACLKSVDAQVLKSTKSFEDEQIIHLSDSVYFQLDSTYFYIASNNSWNVDSRIQHSYDQNGYLSYSLSQKNNNGIWDNLNQISITYSEDSTRWSKEYSVWNKEIKSWQNTWKKNYIENNSGSEINITYLEWGQNKSWNNIWQQTQYYNNSNKLLSYQTIRWNTENNTWESYWDYNCYYDDNGNLLQVTHKSFNKETQIWDDKWECIKDYTSGQAVSELIMDWDLERNEWNNISNTSISYPEVDKVIKTKNHWESEQESWIKNMRETESTNRIENSIEITQEYWDNNLSSWRPQRLNILTFNDKNIKTSEETYYWNQNTATWEYNFKKVYFYTQLSIPKEEDLLPEIKELVVYPNPAKSEIYLQFNGEAQQLNIYKSNGTLILHITDPVNGQYINVSHLKKGVYIAKMLFKGGVAETKFIKK